MLETLFRLLVVRGGRGTVACVVAFRPERVRQLARVDGQCCAWTV